MDESDTGASQNTNGHFLSNEFADPERTQFPAGRDENGNLIPGQVAPTPEQIQAQFAAAAAVQERKLAASRALAAVIDPSQLPQPPRTTVPPDLNNQGEPFTSDENP